MEVLPARMCFRFDDGTDRGIHTIKSALQEINRQKSNSSMDKMGLYATHRKTSLVLGLITKDIKDSAHELRYFGNYGAHVQDDGLDKVERQEARNVRENTWQLLYSIYVAPYKTDELRKARAGKGKP